MIAIEPRRKGAIIGEINVEGMAAAPSQKESFSRRCAYWFSGMAFPAFISIKDLI
jgi:hypothetical protein